jgi:tol-pal system protein YbgF
MRATIMTRSGLSVSPRIVAAAGLTAGAVMFILAQPTAAVAQMSQSDMVVRLDQLESDMRRLTGTLEELQFRNQQLEQMVRQMQAERGGAPARPAMAPAPVGPPPSGPAPATVPGRRSDVFDPAQNPSAPGAPRNLGSIAATAGGPIAEPPAPIPNAPGSAANGQVNAPLDLGTMSANAAGGDAPPLRNPAPPGPQLATLPPSQNPRDEFDLAYGYVLRKDYVLAEQAFQDFLRKYPSDRMAGEAQFWLGESLFQSKNYQSAAEAFVTMTKKYPSSAKQPDTLLRLGQSLAALQQRDLACVTLAEVGKKFPRAAPNVKAAVEREQKRVHC